MTKTTSTAANSQRTPDTRKFYPGWTMLGFAAASQFMSAPGQSYSVSAFNEPMQESLGMSATTLSLAYGVATIVSGVILPWTGRLVDRLGARVVLPIVASLLAVACFVMSMVNNAAGLYAGFTMIRCLGQGAMWLIGTWIVGEWFLRRRGFATAVSGLGGSISAMCFPVLNLYLIKYYGWQTAWQVLGVIVGVTMIVPSILFLRNRPEDLGLHPDGIEPDSDEAAEVDENPHVQATTESWTIGEVLRDLTFWKLISVGVCAGMIGTGLVFHQETILDGHGISKDLAMWMISCQAAIGTLATLGAGWLSDRWPAERLMGLAMLMFACAISILIFMPHWSFVFFFALLNGLHGSVLRTTGTVVWINYYGRANQGVIRGAALSSMILAAAVGPVPLALSNDYLGSYQPALIGFVLLPLVSMLLVFTAKRPTRNES